MKHIYVLFFLTLFSVLTNGVSLVQAKTKTPKIVRTLFVNIQSLNRTTGAVVFSGVDTKPVVNTGFVWIWGDGTTTNGFFPQTKTYSNTSRNYTAKVVSNYTDGQTDTVSVFVEFVGSIITTIAGPPTIGDGGQAVLATLNNPEGIAIDGVGNTYITEGISHRIRRISPTGIITTVAGTGESGFSGDGGPATAAKINQPTSIVVDAAGNVFFADWANNRIRKISTSGIITTVAGNGNYGFSGDGGPATNAMLSSAYGIGIDAAGALYIADWNNHRIRKVSTTGIITTIAGTTAGAGFSGDGGLAINARLNSPTGVAVDASGNVYIGDYQNNRIRKINTSGIISTLAGTGTQGATGDGGTATAAQISFFAGPTVDGTGNVYVPDFVNHRIRKINTSGIITHVAGTTTGAGNSGDGGLATLAALSGPLGLALDVSGNLLIADRGNQQVRRVNTAGIISKVAGPNNAGFGGDNDLATFARLNLPVDVKADGNGNFYIADLYNHRIRKVDALGIISTVAGTTISGFSGDGGAATAARLSGPYGVLPDAAGNIYIADQFNNRIRKISPAGIITTLAGTGVAGFSGDGGPATNAQLNFPSTMALDASGNLYIADANNNRIRKVSTNGIISTVAGTGMAGFGGDGGTAAAAQLNFPTGIALDAANNLYIADNRNQRIRKVTAAGVITTIAGTGVIGYSGNNVSATTAQLAYPFGIAVSVNGTVFFSDNGNVRIRKISANGIISDVAGTATRGYLGDGGLATAAQLDGPFGLGLDGFGNLLIADGANARIRKVACVDTPTVSLIASSSNVCTGDVVSLTIGGSNISNLTYQFFGNVVSINKSTVSVIAMAGLNSYTMVATTPSGCSAITSIKLHAGGLYSIKSGNWDDPLAWSCGRVPVATDIPTISSNHTMTLTGIGVAQNVIINGRLNYGPVGKLYLGSANLGEFTIAKRNEVATQVLSSGGGTIVVNNSDPTLNGLKIQVPSRAYNTSRTFKISYSPIIKHSIKSDFNPITPLIHIENSGGFADSMMTVNIPISLPQNYYAIAMMYSKEKGFELLPTISMTSNEITVMTNHFDSNVLAGKLPQSQLKSTISFSEDVGIDLIVSIISKSKLDNVSLKTAFKPGIDDWEFTNYGSFSSPGGICSGMSVAAMWYFDNIKNKISPRPVPNNLFANKYLQKIFIPEVALDTDKVWMDNALGVKFSSEIQLLNNIKNLGIELRKFSIDHKLENDQAIKSALTSYFRIQTRPLFLGLQSRNKKNFHAVIVCGIDERGILISDPNKPGKESVVTYTSDGFLYRTSEDVDQSEEDYIYFICLPPSLIIDPGILEDLWNRVDNETPTIGDGILGKHKFLLNGISNIEIKENSDLSVTGPFSIVCDPTQTEPNCHSCVATLYLLEKDANSNDNIRKMIPDVNNKYTLPLGIHKVGFYVTKKQEIIKNQIKEIVEDWYDFKWIKIDVLLNPLVYTQQIMGVTFNSAQVQGVIQNYKNVITYGVCYSSNNSQPTINDSKIEYILEANPPENKTFVAGLTNLQSATNFNANYYIRTFARTLTEVIYGNVLQFYTAVKPSVFITDASSTTSTSAQLGAFIQNYKTGEILSYGICYSDVSTLPTINNNVIEYTAEASETINKSFTATIANLELDVKYYARAFIKTSSGIIYSDTYVPFYTKYYNPNVLHEHYFIINVDNTKYEVYDAQKYSLTNIPNEKKGRLDAVPLGIPVNANLHLDWYSIIASWLPQGGTSSFDNYIEISIYDPPFTGTKQYIINKHLVDEYLNQNEYTFYSAVSQKHPYIHAALSIDGLLYLSLEGGKLKIERYYVHDRMKGTFIFQAAEYKKNIITGKFASTGKIVNVTGELRILSPY